MPHRRLWSESMLYVGAKIIAMGYWGDLGHPQFCDNRHQPGLLVSTEFLPVAESSFHTYTQRFSTLYWHRVFFLLQAASPSWHLYGLLDTPSQHLAVHSFTTPYCPLLHDTLLSTPSQHLTVHSFMTPYCPLSATFLHKLLDCYPMI
jgi:hypothetical protein